MLLFTVISIISVVYLAFAYFHYLPVVKKLLKDGNNYYTLVYSEYEKANNILEETIKKSPKKINSARANRDFYHRFCDLIEKKCNDFHKEYLSFFGIIKNAWKIKDKKFLIKLSLLGDAEIAKICTLVEAEINQNPPVNPEPQPTKNIQTELSEYETPPPTDPYHEMRMKEAIKETEIASLKWHNAKWELESVKMALSALREKNDTIEIFLNNPEKIEMLMAYSSLMKKLAISEDQTSEMLKKSAKCKNQALIEMKKTPALKLEILEAYTTASKKAKKIEFSEIQPSEKIKKIEEHPLNSVPPKKATLVAEIV